MRGIGVYGRIAGLKAPVNRDKQRIEHVIKSGALIPGTQILPTR